MGITHAHPYIHAHYAITPLSAFYHTLSLHPSQSVVLSHLAIIPAASFIATFTPPVPVLLSPHIFPSECLCLVPRFPIITSHLWGPLLRRASHLSPRCDNRYRWHSPPGLSPINTCSALSLSFLPLFHLYPSLPSISPFILHSCIPCFLFFFGALTVLSWSTPFFLSPSFYAFPPFFQTNSASIWSFIPQCRCIVMVALWYLFILDPLIYIH